MSSTISLSDAACGYPLGVDGFMTGAEVEQYLNVSRWTTRRLRQAGLLRATRLQGGRRLRYCRRSVLEYARHGEE